MSIRVHHPASYPNVTATIRLSGGHAEKPRTIAAYRAGQHVDMDVRSADGKEFQAHGLVLRAASDYFEALVGGGWRSSSPGPQLLGAVPGDALEACLEWIYTGSCVVAGESALRGILDAAVYLQIAPLTDAVKHAIRDKLRPANALATWCMADTYGFEDLAELAATAACRHFGRVTADADWLACPPALAQVLLADSRLRVAGEEEVYYAAIAWLRARRSASADEALALLAHVRYPRVKAPAFVAEVVLREPLVLAALREELGHAAPPPLLFAAFAGSLEARPTQRAVRRQGGAAALYALGGADAFSLERYDPAADAWACLYPVGSDSLGTRPAGQVSARDADAVAALDGQLYVFFNGGVSVERFDPAARAWQEVAWMIPGAGRGRAKASAAAFDGKLYVAGGGDGLATTALVQRYDPRANTWAEVAPMTKKREQHAAVVLDGRLYVTGGVESAAAAPYWQAQHFPVVLGDDVYMPGGPGNGSDPLPKRSLERYDPAANSWERVAPMRTRRRGHGAAALAGKLYVAGGTDDERVLRSVERFDPITNAWEQLAPMLTARVGCSAAVLDGELYVAGGVRDADDYEEGPLASVERYDPLTNRWEALAPMRVARDGLGLCCC